MSLFKILFLVLHLDNTIKMSVKCLLIVPVKMIFFRFVKLN